MIPQALTTSPVPSPGQPIGSQIGRSCLVVGGVLLAAGCYLGATAPGDRSWSLTLLFISVVLFAAAGAHEFRRHAASTADKVAGVVPAKGHIAAVPSETPEPPPRTAPDPAPATPVVTALTVVVPPSGRATPSQAAPTPPPTPSPTTVPAPHRAEAQLDVATLIELPLSDLLLAALCKDPLGARRIFAQALMQSDPGVAPGPVTQPASARTS